MIKFGNALGSPCSPLKLKIERNSAMMKFENGLGSPCGPPK